jgi:Hemerythrin HHE cation binding domain.
LEFKVKDIWNEILELRNQHAYMWRKLDELERSHDNVRDALNKLMGVLLTHNSLEEGTLYPIN